MTTYRKKLIEVALPLEAINKASAREKSIRHGHPSTLHLWWARRPLAACRAVLFGQLVDDPSSCTDEFPTEEEQAAERLRLHGLIEELVIWENSTNEEVLNRARFEIARSVARDDGKPALPSKDDPQAILDYLQKHALPVYDPFSGGGSIPLEAQRLGLRAYGSDLNPVAVMIGKALIEFPPRFAGKAPIHPETSKKLINGNGWQGKGAQGLAEDVRAYGQWMRDEAQKRIGHLYPHVEVTPEMAAERDDLKPYEGEKLTVIAWLWARTVASPNPSTNGAHVPLVRSFALSTKKGKLARVEPIIDQANSSYHFEVRTGEGDVAEGIVNRGGGRCILTDTPIPFKYIRAEAKAGRMGARLLAVVAEGKKGRVYLSPTDDIEKIAKSASGGWHPDGEISHWPGRTNVVEYGMTKFGDLFTPRQLLALTCFSDLVAEAREKVLIDARKAAHLPDDTRPLRDGGTGPEAYADAVAVYLAFAVDRLSDLSSTISTWIVNLEAVRGTFARQALPMTWDYAECNPVTDKWIGAVGWVGKVIDWLPASAHGHVFQRDAANGGIDEQTMIISTDPPYYDNIGYADLSDFFYVWMRRSLKPVFPDECSTMLVPKDKELVATPYRHDGKANAETFFMEGMTKAILNMVDLSNGIPTAIYYAFKQAEVKKDGISSTGWSTFLEAVCKAGYTIDGTWPMRSERAARTNAIDANALASSIVLVCRKRPDNAPITTRAAFLKTLKQEVPPAIKLLQQGNIAPVDMAQAAIGPGMAVFTRYQKVLESNDSVMSVKTALQLINEVLDESLCERESDFDSDTRFAITWFESNGMSNGSYGDAEGLAKARNVSVSGIVDAGIIESRGGKVRILKRNEMLEDWDPATDNRLTVWECTQYLIRTMENDGETAAASLLAAVGGRGDAAKDLAYRLYGICERNKWSEEARAYNALVTAWPELTILAAQSGVTPGPDQSEMKV